MEHSYRSVVFIGMLNNRPKIRAVCISCTRDTRVGYTGVKGDNACFAEMLYHELMG